MTLLICASNFLTVLLETGTPSDCLYSKSPIACSKLSTSTGIPFSANFFNRSSEINPSSLEEELLVDADP
jgi:hypothetical protein